MALAARAARRIDRQTGRARRRRHRLRLHFRRAGPSELRKRALGAPRRTRAQGFGAASRNDADQRPRLRQIDRRRAGRARHDAGAVRRSGATGGKGRPRHGRRRSRAVPRRLSGGRGAPRLAGRRGARARRHQLAARSRSGGAPRSAVRRRSHRARAVAGARSAADREGRDDLYRSLLQRERPNGVRPANRRQRRRRRRPRNSDRGRRRHSPPLRPFRRGAGDFVGGGAAKPRRQKRNRGSHHLRRRPGGGARRRARDAAGGGDPGRGDSRANHRVRSSPARCCRDRTGRRGPNFSPRCCCSPSSWRWAPPSRRWRRR